jgi:hypothetical protein
VNEWTLTFDATHAPTLAAFWMLALGYEAAPPPKGFQSWDDWFDRFEVPEQERDGLASIVDPDGLLPRISFLRVPEPKTAKNRIHLDVQVGGGRSVEHAVRWPRVEAMVEVLTAAGGHVLSVHREPGGEPDHVVMLDPEGNELCVL